MSQLLQDFGNILETGGSDIEIVPEIQRMKFLKDCWNVVFSSLATLTQSVKRPHFMIRALISLFSSYSSTVPVIFRPPPTDSSTIYVSPTTADLISTFTIPSVEAILIELLTLGKGFPYYYFFFQFESFRIYLFAISRNSHSRIPLPKRYNPL